jgi:hypothetical protein
VEERRFGKLLCGMRGDGAGDGVRICSRGFLPCACECNEENGDADLRTGRDGAWLIIAERDDREADRLGLVVLRVDLNGHSWSFNEVPAKSTHSGVLPRTCSSFFVVRRRCARCWLVRLFVVGGGAGNATLVDMMMSVVQVEVLRMGSTKIG